MATDLLRERLPPGWQFGVTEDGRIFFIDEYRQETSWLHPVTGLPVESGMHPHPDLPPGWEQDSTPDGLTYYVDHNQRVTTFEHPFYGVNPPPPFEHIHNEAPNEQQYQQQQQQQHQLAHGPSQPGLPVELQGLSPQPSQSPTTPGSPTSPGGKENFKRGAPKQRSVKAPSAKRNPQAVVIKKGWLHRLENTGISKSKAWKRRWCVLADFALFIYKGEDEQTTLDSILLPSYRINPSTEADNIKRNFVFKVEHENTKTLYLAAEDSPDSVSWMSNLRQAAMMDGNIGSFQREQNNNFRQHQKSGTAGGMRSNNSPEHQGDTGSQNTDKYGPGGRDTGNRSQYSPSYQGYGDPASSPPYSQQQQHYGPQQQQQQQQLQPQHQQQYGPQQQQQPYPAHRQSYTSSDDGGFNPYSLSRGFDRNSQASYKQDESFRGQNSGRMEDRPDARDPRKFSNPIYQQFPSPSTSSGSTRPQLQQHQQRPPNQQQQLRDGFAPDSESARNSLAQSDSSGHRFYQPAQAERQRLQQQLGGMATSPHSHPQQSPNPESVYSVGRHHRAMDSFQRDSYSGESSTDGPHHHQPYKNSHSPSHQVVVKQLRPWDTSFPDLEVVTAKQHGSFDDLLDPGNRVGRQSARGPGGPSSKATFNARSKSHENFSRLPPEHGPPGMQQPPHNAAQHQHQQQHQQHPHNNHGPNTRDDQPPSFRNSTRYQPETGSPGDSRNYPGNQGYMGHPHHPQQHLQQQQQHHQQQPHHSPAGSLSSSQVSPQERQHQRDGHLPPSSRNPPQGFRNSYASSTNVVKPFNPNTSNQQQPSPYPGSDDRNASFRGSFHNNSNQSFQQTRPLSLASSAQVPSPSSSSQNNPHHHHDRGGSDIVNPHTYVNFPNRGPGSNAVRAGYEGPTPRDEPPRNSSSYLAPPGRPPYPVAVRRQIVEEMAQVQTPVTQNDFLTSAELNQQRMQQPSFFQYPSPRDQYGNETNHHNMSQASMHSGAGRNLPNSRLSSASRVSTASRRGDGNRSSDLPDSSSSRRGGSGRDGQGQSSPHETSFSRTNMMDPEAQKLRMAYERVHSLRMAPDKAKTSQNSSVVNRAKNPGLDTTAKHSFHDNHINPHRGNGIADGKGVSSSASGFHKDEHDNTQQQHNNVVMETREDSIRLELERANGHQEGADRMGRTPPPTGAYHRIPDEPVDLYRRGSAFSPPATQPEDKLEKSDAENSGPRSYTEQHAGLANNGGGSQKRNAPRERSGYPGKDDGVIVRARLVSIYDNVKPVNLNTRGAAPSTHQSDVPNSNFEPTNVNTRGSAPSTHHQSDLPPGNEAKQTEDKYSHGRDMGSTSKESEMKESLTESNNNTQEEGEHLFYEPYVNIRDAQVLFPRDMPTDQVESRNAQFNLTAPPKRKPAPIQTVKEDPNMSDREVLETNLQKITKKNPLAGPRLRMSISAGDLIGKTHDELVLLLIQLRRNQAALEKARDYYRTLIDRCRPDELEYKRQMHQFGNVQDHQLLLKHQNYVDARGQTEEVENKLEVYKPIINLLDNMVTMGSLYGGDNLMLATQYRKHLLRPDQYQPPKKMLEFSRQHQEHRLQLETEQEIQQLSSDEVDLEEKIDRLNELDRLLQEQSFKVSSFREDKELLEKALVGVLRQQDQSYHGDPREMTRLTNQQRMLEQEISRVTQQLAEASKELEETSAENSKLEHEVALLRTKVHGELSRSRSAPSLSSENVRTKQQMEKELAKVEGIMAGLNQRGQKLQQAMSTIRRSSSSSHLAAANLDKLDNAEGSSPTSPRGTYLQTDLDSGEQLDLAQASISVTNGAVSHDNYPSVGDSGSYAVSEETSPRPVINHQRQNAGSLEDWDMEGVDENTKRFFGLMPRDKPKGQTLREVKRLSEQRKEREKGRRDGDDSLDGQEIKLRVSNVDTEVSSIIHARIPSDKLVPNGNSSNSNGQFESGLPLYENLPGRNKTNPDAGSSTNGINHYPTTARRSSLILMAPKPFTPYQDRSSARPFKSELALNVAGSDTQDSGMQFPSVWRPSNSVAPSNDRPYHSVDFLNTPHESRSNIPVSSQPGFNSNVHHKRGDSNLYPSDTNNNNNNDSSIFNKNERAYENDYIPQGQNYESSYQYQPTEISQQIIPNESADHITRPVDPNNIQTSTSRAYAARPWATKGAQFSDDNIFNSRRNSRGRYMTISSSEPIKMEINPTLHSSAGDLILNRSIDNVPDIVKSSQTIVDQIDEGTIDREILYVPDKVLIPERYDAEADAEQLTEEESLARKERAERIRKVLTSQSVLSMSQPDVSQLPAEEVHSRVRQEKREREHFLALNQELARQVTLKSKKQAAERRKTWSGAQFADAKAQYEADMAGSPGSPQLRSPDSERKRAEITLHDL